VSDDVDDLLAVAQEKSNETRGRALMLGKSERDTVLTLCDAVDALAELIAELSERVGEPKPKPEALAKYYSVHGPMIARMPPRDWAIDELGLSTRARNALENNGITSVRGLEGLSAARLLRFKNLGRGCLGELRSALAARGVALTPAYPPSNSVGESKA
jgi:DNA-directed RNA polymerase alpha subunit